MRAFLTESVTVATDKKDVFDRVIGLIKMFGHRSRISKVAIVENGTAMLPKAFVEMALGLPNVQFAAFFAFNEVDKVFGFTV